MRVTLLLSLLIAISSPSWANQVSSEDLEKLTQYGESLPRVAGGNQPINLPVSDPLPEASERFQLLREYANQLHILHLERVARDDQLEVLRQRQAELDLIAQDYAGRGAYFDSARQLLWARCAFGQQWTQAGDCGGTAQTLTLPQAQAVAAEYRLSDHDDWRLPSADELRSLVSCAESDAQLTLDSEQCQDNAYVLAVGNQLFPNNPAGIYWSQSPSPRRSYFNKAVESSSGKIHHVDHAYSYYLRPVRSTDH